MIILLFYKEVFCMTEKEFREKYGTLKFQEMFERDEDKRKEISKQIKTLETTYKQSAINIMLDENENTSTNLNDLGELTK